jgi:addiction module HigA family antidote
MIQTRKPSHPGMFFKFTVLDDRGISITSAAGSLGVTRKALSEFVNGRSKCSHAMARRLSEATGTGVANYFDSDLPNIGTIHPPLTSYRPCINYPIPSGH